MTKCMHRTVPGRFGPESFRPESFRPWVVSAWVISAWVVSALGRFGPGSFRPNLVGRFGLIFSKSSWERYDRLKKNVMMEWG